MKLSLGFSPCPNDTFIFDAMIHHKVDTEGLEFDVFFDDVESLNNKAFKQEADICKLSYHAYAYAIENYVLLNAGSALGFGVGPLLISKDSTLTKEIVEQNSVDYTAAIPGKYTTANFLLGLAFPELQNKTAHSFSAIEGMLINNKVDLGLIIHENRFTYHKKGLHKIIDLGDFWEKKTGFPIPLGGIAIKRSLDKAIHLKVDRVLRRSVEYAFKNPESSIEFTKFHAQEMEESVMRKHIELYVNDFSVNLGAKGRKAVQTLFDEAIQLKTIPHNKNNLFID